MQLNDKLRDAIDKYQSGNYAESERISKEILQNDPHNARALNLLGMSLHERGLSDAGIVFIKKATEINPDYPAAHNNLGTVYRERRHFELSLPSIDRAIALNSTSPEYHLNKASVLLEMGDYEKALSSFQKTISLHPELVEAYIGRGAVLCKLQRFPEALASYDKAIEIQPSSAEGWEGRGSIFKELKNYDNALAAYDRAITLTPDLAGAWLGRGNIFIEFQQYDNAFAAYDRALTLKPDLAEAWLGRGNIFKELKQHDNAFAAYDRALTLKPDLAEAWLGRGNVLFELNRDDEALVCYEKAIGLNRNLAEAYFGKSLLKLALGNYDEGWALYEWRLKTKQVRHFSKQRWLGDINLVGKTILVHSEQGFGDTIQFYRYLSKLKTLGCGIIFETHASLVPLFESQKGDLKIITTGGDIPHFDVHCPLMSLPLAFKTTLETIPANIPYLIPSVEKIKRWQGKLGAKNKPRIGLVWSGNPRYANDINRTIPLNLFVPIFGTGAEFHSLQKDVREVDRGMLESNFPILDHAPSLIDFSDTAALIAEMDLVISVDTSVAHLAGALGKPIWILLPFHPDFRWMRDKEDSPWYPTARLFRQRQQGEWRDVIDRALLEIKKLMVQA